MLGPLVVVGTRPVLALAGEKVLEISKGQLSGTGPQSVVVDVDLRDERGMEVLAIDQNFLELKVDGVEDLEVPERARELALRHKGGTQLKLFFKRLREEELRWLLRKRLKTVPHLHDSVVREATQMARDSEGLFPTLLVDGRFHNNDVDVRVTPAEVKVAWKVGRPTPETSTLGPHLIGTGGSIQLNDSSGLVAPGPREVLRFG